MIEEWTFLGYKMTADGNVEMEVKARLAFSLLTVNAACFEVVNPWRHKIYKHKDKVENITNKCHLFSDK